MADQRLQQIRDRREAGCEAALDLLAASLHETFCDDDGPVGPWDRAVVEHVIQAYENLPVGLHSALFSTMALRGSLQ